MTSSKLSTQISINELFSVPTASIALRGCMHGIKKKENRYQGYVSSRCKARLQPNFFFHVLMVRAKSLSLGELVFCAPFPQNVGYINWDCLNYRGSVYVWLWLWKLMSIKSYVVVRSTCSSAWDRMMNIAKYKLRSTAVMDLFFYFFHFL